MRKQENGLSLEEYAQIWVRVSHSKLITLRAYGNINVYLYLLEFEKYK